MRGAGILVEVAPEIFWDKLQKFLADIYGIMISGKDLHRVAERMIEVIQMQSEIQILPGKGEDMDV